MRESIIDYIPYGKENAVSRNYLVTVTGYSDRKVRDMISKAREKDAILNLSDGSGYYRPTEEDGLDVNLYIQQELHRSMAIMDSLAGAESWLRTHQLN